MADEEIPVPHYTALPPRTDNPEEPIAYDCSLCDDDIFNISMHSQFDHGIKRFTIEHTETPRDFGVPGSVCGVNGCDLNGNHENLPHSWEILGPSH